MACRQPPQRKRNLSFWTKTVMTVITTSVLNLHFLLWTRNSQMICSFLLTTTSAGKHRFALKLLTAWDLQRRCNFFVINVVTWTAHGHPQGALVHRRWNSLKWTCALWRLCSPSGKNKVPSMTSSIRWIFPTENSTINPMKGCRESTAILLLLQQP